MLDKKDKYRLRSLANPLKPLVIIGKDGLTENIISSINDAIKTHELTSLPQPIKDDCVFNGWHLTPDFSDSAITTFLTLWILSFTT